MAKSSSISSGDLLHFGAVRFRVVGSGDLQVFLKSLDDINTVQLANITMAAATNREPTVLANFTEQRASLEIKTTEIDETFVIGKIVVFVKPTYTGYPQ